MQIEDNISLFRNYNCFTDSATKYLHAIDSKYAGVRRNKNVYWNYCVNINPSFYQERIL